MVVAFDRSGLINDITQILSSDNINMIDAKVQVTKGIADIFLKIEVSDINQLSRLLTRIENIPNVLEAKRHKMG
jgi:GTP pyrophosphokinase